MIKQTLTPASIAFHRFGLGASVDDTVVSDARRFLFDQFASYEAVPAVMGLLPDGDALRISFLADRREARRWSSEKLGSPSDTAHQGKVAATHIEGRQAIWPYCAHRFETRLSPRYSCALSQFRAGAYGQRHPYTCAFRRAHGALLGKPFLRLGRQASDPSVGGGF